ncbi:MAG: hypothetical protein ACRD6B_04100 [Bryobacteraceae bacterium]
MTRLQPTGGVMPTNAKPRDAQAGWQIYRESGYQATLEEVNAELTRRGFGEIRQRTYDHYRKLHRYGYQRYVPINIVDVETHHSPPWGSPLRSRYRPRPANIDVQLVVVAGSQTIVIDGQTVELSNAEASVRVSTEALTGLADIGVSSLEGLQVLVAFASSPDEPARSAEVELVYPDPGEPFTVLTLAFLTPIETSEIPGAQLLPSGVVTVTLDVVDPNSPDVLVRTLTALFEAFDASRVWTDEILAALDADGQFALPTVTVSQLTMSSPLVVVLSGAAAVLGFFRWQIRGLLKLRQQWYEGSVVRSDAHIGDAEAVSRGAHAKLTEAQARNIDEQTRALRIKNDLDQKVAEIESASALAVVVRLLEHSAPPLAGRTVATEQPDLISELFKNQVLPSLEKLLADTLRSIDVQPDAPLEETLRETLPEDEEGADGSGESDPA